MPYLHRKKRADKALQEYTYINISRPTFNAESPFLCPVLSSLRLALLDTFVRTSVIDDPCYEQDRNQKFIWGHVYSHSFSPLPSFLPLLFPSFFLASKWPLKTSYGIWGKAVPPKKIKIKLTFKTMENFPSGKERHL